MLVRRLGQAFAPMAKVFAASKPGEVRCTCWREHISRPRRRWRKASDRDDGAALRQGEAGEWAAQLFASLIDAAMPAPDMAPADYPDFYRTLVARKSIRPRERCTPRLSICDPFEARLQQADVVILGGLNEGTSPTAADPGPWLNRPMRETLGLPAPEESIGAAAHDFTASRGSARGADARRQGRRRADRALALGAAARGAGEGPRTDASAERPWIAWARRAMPLPARRGLCGRPSRGRRWRAPAPAQRHGDRDVDRQPLRDLRPARAGAGGAAQLGERPGPSLRGQIVHDALGRFAQRFPERLPGDIAKELMAIATEVLADYTSATRAWRRSGCRGWRASLPGSPRPSGRAAPALPRRWPRPTASWCWRGRPVPSR